jgi:hypothetical protein
VWQPDEEEPMVRWGGRTPPVYSDGP